MKPRIVASFVLVGVLVILALLASSSVSLADPASPMKPAYDCATVRYVPQTECEILKEFYTHTGGDNWTVRDRWWVMPLTPCDSSPWYGLRCNWKGYTSANIMSIGLGNNNLSGNIPPALGDLTDLWELHLPWNRLGSFIPPELASLRRLQQLDLSHNILRGRIPLQLADLTSLQKLDLSYNSLSGNIPPDFGRLANLQELSLRSNELTGTIPSELGSLANLEYLLLDFNQLSDNIPPELGQLTNLRRLYLSDNQLSGTVPTQLSDLPRIEQIYLHNNQLGGALPESLTKLHLTHFTFAGTNLCEPSDPAFQTWLVGIPNLSRTGILCPTPTPTSTPTATCTATPTVTPTPSATLTPSPTATETSTPTSTPTFTPTPTPTIRRDVLLPLVIRDPSPTPTPTPTSTNTSTPTWTPTATPTFTATPTATTPPEPAGIYGRVTYKGNSASGIQLTLQLWNGAAWSSIAQTNTGADGSYLFGSVPSLEASHVYYVLYGSNATDSRYLEYWFGPQITAYSSGTRTRGGEFDIANVVLLTPPSGGSLRLPVTFTWQRRGLPGDTYRLVLFDPNGTDWWPSPDLGDVGGISLISLPPGVSYGKQYGWLMYVFSGSEGHGTSFYYRRVTFVR